MEVPSQAAPQRHAIQEIGCRGSIAITGSSRLTEPGRQLDESARFQSTEQLAAGNLTKAPLGLAPVPNLAEAIGNMAASLSSLLLNQLSDEQQVGFPNKPAPNHQILVHGHPP